MHDKTLIFEKKPANVIIITGVVSAILIPFCLSMVFGGLSTNYLDKLVYSRFIFWGVVLFLLFYAYKVERQPLFLWKEYDPDIGFFIVSVVLLYLLYILALWISAIPALFGWHDNNIVMKKILLLLKGHTGLIVFISLTAGVTEEIIMRGYLLTRLMQLFKSPIIPVLISSIIFSALHYKYYSLHELIFTFLIGVIFSIYYIKYQNIKVLIVTHFLIDLISLLVSQHLLKK